MANHGRSHWQSRFRNLVLGPLGLCLLLLAVVSCGDQNTMMTPTDGPLVRIHVAPVDGQSVQAVLSATALDPTGTQKTAKNAFTTAPFDLLGVTFPIGTRGQTSFQVDLYGPSSCLLSSGTAQVNIDSDGVLDVSVNMVAVPFCGNGAVISVQVANILGGKGLVTSSPTGISCDGLGNGCSLTVMKGSQVTLTANELSGTFAGWSGGGCGSTSPCVVTVSQDVVVQATFSLCKGWCKETLPSAPTTNFNAVGGTATNNVLIAGDNGVIYAWDGGTWKTVPSPAGTKALRAVTGKSSGATTYVAGDGGTVLKWTGGAMTQLTTNSTANLRALAIANGAVQMAPTLAVGDGGVSLVIAPAGTVTNGMLMASGINLLSICQAPSAKASELWVGGSVTAAPVHGFAAQWDGAAMTTAQMAMGMNIPGNINAMLCGTTAFHYAAGDNGAMVRRAVGGKNDNNWSAVTSMAGTNAIRAIWASSDNYIVAVGDGGIILQSDGNTWNKITSGVTTPLRAIWGSSPINIYAVGDNGTVLHYSP